MARSFAQIQVSIWSDEDFKELDQLAQHMYFVLISQPRVNLVGVMDYMPKRLAACCYTMSTEDVESAVKTLVEHRFVLVDEETQELLIRSFVRRDGLLRTPNVAKGAAADFGEVMSERLRDAIEKELRRAYRDEPDLHGWKGIKDANSVLFKRVSERATA